MENIREDKSFKIKLIKILLTNKIDLEYQNFELISAYSEIEEIICLNKLISLKIIYFNKTNIHKILYETDNIIYLNYFNNNIGNYFYLDLLILDIKNIVNYSYSFNFIQKIVNYSENKLKIVSKLILARIIINLLYNYKQTDIYNEKEEEDELNKIENNNKSLIKNNINIFKDLGLNFTENDFINKKIDELYIEIIIGLIKKHKFEDYEYVHDIFEQLDLENIEFTKHMLDKLYKILNKENNCIKEYLIKNEDDLIEIKKINFYYILSKYVLKSPIYIYQIELLLNNRNYIIKLIMNNKLNQMYILRKKINKEIQERLEYIIKKLTNSEYYFQKYLKYRNIYELNKLKQILLYYESFFFETKKDDINIIKTIFKNNQNENYERYLKDYETAIKMNSLFDIINYIYNIKNENVLTENKLSQYVKDWNFLEKMIKDKKFKKIGKITKIKLINYLNDEQNKEKVLNIFNEDEYKLFIKENIQLLESKNKENLLNEELSKIKGKKQTKINTNEKNSINIPKKDDTSIIKESYTINSNFSISKPYNESIICKNKDEFKLSHILEHSYDNDLELYTKSTMEEVIGFIKTIGDHKISEIIKYLSKGHYISSGRNSKLFLYNKSFQIVLEIGIKEWVYNIYEYESTKENEINILVCCGVELLFIIINIVDYTYKIQKYILEDYTFISLFQIGNNNFVISGQKGTIFIQNLFSGIERKNKYSRLFNQFYRGGIKVNDSIIAFTSNRISPDEEDKLIFYNLSIRKTVKIINNFSFILSSNGLCLISLDDYQTNNKLLLCGCKKNIINQKNGILLIDIISGKGGEKFYHTFYDTNNFEVYCFCQLFDIKNENLIDEDITLEKKIKLNKTDYFLVGGFDEEIMEGMIKLYKIEYKKNNNESKIIYIQDIIIEKNDEFEGFENAISCITQSQITGNIIVTCWDGKVQLFRPPNLEFYLNC